MLNEAASPTLAVTPCALSGRRAWAVPGWRCTTLNVSAAAPIPCGSALIFATASEVTALAAARDAQAPGVGLAVIAPGLAPPADDRIDVDAPDSDLAALLARWRPLPLPEALERQIATFGPVQILPLLTRLRERMVWSVSTDIVLTSNDAHQLAGIAGILGFADVGAGWEAVSRDGGSARIDARRATRRAIAALDRSGLCAPHH